MFMSRELRPLIATLFTISVSILLFCCGVLPSETVPTANPSLTVSANGSAGPLTLRADGKDSATIAAKVQGLSTQVGFHLPAGFGTFSGTASADGYTYVSADSSGVAQVVLTASTVTGQTTLTVRSLEVTATIPVQFDFGTFTVFPATLTLPAVDGARGALVSRGGRGGITWYSENTSAIAVTKTSDSDARVSVKNAASFDRPVTVTAVDGGGASATATISPGAAACSASTLTLSTTAPAAGDTVSVTLSDFNQAGSLSVTVSLTGAASGVLTLPEWMSPGIFSSTYAVPITALAGDAFTFSTVAKDATCTSITLSAAATVP
jgi:hypothetical protein